MTSAIQARRKANFECLDTHTGSVTVRWCGAQVREQSKRVCGMPGARARYGFQGS
jgi:hypothetical protein